MIHIDHREHRVINFFTQEHLVINNMKQGDYAIVNGDVALHVFERKAMPDLCASIKSKNLHLDNMIGLKNAGCQVAYIIESTKVFYDDETVVEGIPFYKIRSMLDSIYIKHGIPVIYTKNPEHTAKTIEKFALKYKQIIASKKEAGESIGGGEAALLSKKAEVSIDERVRVMWEAFPGIGANIAANLMINYSLKDLLSINIQTIRDTKINGRKIGNKKDLEDSIVEYQSGKNGIIHFDILRKVNGVGDQRARRILDQVNFHTMDSGQISDIIFNGRRMGKLGFKIMDYLNYKKSYNHTMVASVEKTLGESMVKKPKVNAKPTTPTTQTAPAAIEKDPLATSSSESN